MFGFLTSEGALNNYQYCAEWVHENARGAPATVLDYGCGAGETIRELGRRGIDAYGCDVFYDGGDYTPDVPPEWLGTRIRRMEGSSIPFPSEHFDFVINNQVMEHVENFDVVLGEIRRVLKPGGMVLSLFADRTVWREGHCGIPFLHRFPKGSRGRVYYAALLRALGFGHHTENKSVMAWSRDFCSWLDAWVFYRPYRSIAESFGRYFSPIEHIEDQWLSRRLGARSRLVAWSPVGWRRLLVSRTCGRVFVCRKNASRP